jgi:TetR/AcrR family transcriptional repressor of nem operon
LPIPTSISFHLLVDYFQSTDDLARLLLGVHLGIRVLARTGPDRALLEGVVRPALALLEVGAASGG